MDVGRDLVALLSACLLVGTTSVAQNVTQPFSPEKWRSNVVESLGDMGFTLPIRVPLEPSPVEKTLFSGVSEFVATNAFGPRLAFLHNKWTRGPDREKTQRLEVRFRGEIADKWKEQIQATWFSIFQTNTVSLAFFYELDLVSGQQAWFLHFTARELEAKFQKNGKIDFQALWSGIVACVPDALKLDSATDEITPSKRVVRSHWKVLAGPYTNSVVSEQLEVTMLMDSDVSTRISVESFVKIRGKESSRERVFRGGKTSLTILREGYVSDEDELIKSIRRMFYSSDASPKSHDAK